MSPRATQVVFVGVGAVHVGLGLVMLFAPGTFYDAVATFPPRNDHLVRDVGTVFVALGVGFGAAARRPAWRAPVLLVAIVQYTLHTANHLYDIGLPAEGWVGPVNALLLAAAAVLLAIVAWVSRARV